MAVLTHGHTINDDGHLHGICGGGTSDDGGDCVPGSNNNGNNNTKNANANVNVAAGGGGHSHSVEIARSNIANSIDSGTGSVASNNITSTD